jgi:hypothetical protein
MDAKLFAPVMLSVPVKCTQELSRANVGSRLLIVAIAFEFVEMSVESVCRLLERSRPPKDKDGAEREPAIVALPLMTVFPDTIRLESRGSERNSFQDASHASSLFVLSRTLTSVVCNRTPRSAPANMIELVKVLLPDHVFAPLRLPF